VVPGKAGNPVIDSDSDGDLSDEVGFVICQDGNTVVFTGSGITTACAAPEGPTAAIVSVANGDSATNATATPMITVYITGQGGDSAEDNDDAFVGYYSSAVNTFRVSAWSTVQLEANASLISVVETGRNTGIFEGEFLVADTEGSNDGTPVKTTAASTTDDGANDATSDASCGTSGITAAASATSAEDGRFDRSGGTYVDCEMIVGQFDVAGADPTAGGSVAITVGTIPAGSNLADTDGDGILYDEIYFFTQGTQGIAAGNVGPSVAGNLEGTAITCGGTLAKCSDGSGGAVIITVTLAAGMVDNTSDKGGYGVPVVNNVVDYEKVDTTLGGGVTAADLKTGRPGSDSASTLGGILGASTAAEIV